MNNVYSCVLKHPARILISGPSSSGKSTLISKILDNQILIFDQVFDRIIYFSDGSSLVTENINLPIANCEIYDKTLFNTLDSRQNNCLIIDDFMHRAADDIQISELFTKRSHHQNVTIIFLLQNLFPKSNVYDWYQEKCQLYFFNVKSFGRKIYKIDEFSHGPFKPTFHL